MQQGPCRGLAAVMDRSVRLRARVTRHQVRGDHGLDVEGGRSCQRSPGYRSQRRQPPAAHQEHPAYRQLSADTSSAGLSGPR